MTTYVYNNLGKVKYAKPVKPNSSLVPKTKRIC